MPPKQLLLAVPELVPILPLRHEEVRVIARDRPEGEEPRFIEVIPGDVDPEPDRGLKAHLGGQSIDGAPEDESGQPDHQRISDPGIQLYEDGGIGHRARPFVDVRPRLGRLRHHVSVEREARVDSPDLKEPHTLATDIEHHGGHGRRAGDPTALARHGVEHYLELLRKGPVGRDLDVGSEEHTGLIVERALYVASERVDRHERGHPQGDGGHENGEAAIARPTLPPGQTNREATAHS